MEKCVFPFPSPSLRLARHKTAFDDLADLSSEPTGTKPSSGAGHPAYQNHGRQSQNLGPFEDEELLSQVADIKVLKETATRLGRKYILQLLNRNALIAEAAAHLAKIAELENQVLEYKEQALTMEEKIQELDAEKTKLALEKTQLEKSNSDLVEDKRQNLRTIDHLQRMHGNDTRGGPLGSRRTGISRLDMYLARGRASIADDSSN